MKLGESVEVVVGTVIEDIDPKKLGRVKVGAPGWFDRNVMSIEAIPWVYPFTMPYYNAFSHISLGGKVWLIINKENEEEYWYIPFHELNNDTREVQGADIDEDIVFSRNINGKVVQLYQNKEDGLVLRNGAATLVLSSGGAVKGSDGQGGFFSVEGGSFYCGSGSPGACVQMVRGDTLYNILTKLASDLSSLATACQPDHASALAEPFNKAASNISNALSELNSKTANLTK